MNIQSTTNPIRDSIERQTEKYKDQGYQRKYPFYKTVRIRNHNLERIKRRTTRYNQTVDDLITIILGRLEYYEKLGYETPRENGSF